MDASAELASAARRNLRLLATGMAALYGMVELAFGASTVTFEETGGSSALAGLAPAVYLACAGLAAVAAGRAMDRSGRRPILIAGFAAGLVGCLVAGLGVSAGSLPLVMLGFGLTGAATGTVLLSRAAAADMFPPERRPRAIAQVLFGAVFGALLGPLLFSPLLSGGDPSGLELAWLGAAGFMLAGLVIAALLRPDPQQIARALAPDSVTSQSASAPLARIVRRPGVPPALLAVLASWAGMVAVMALSGAALLDHGHDQDAVFPVLSAHFVGMFALFGVVGPVIERIGRTRAIAGGLLLLAVSTVGLLGTVDSIPLAAVTLFGVGLGWSLSFVAATAELAERAEPAERAGLIGFADLLGDLAGAALVVAGGFALAEVGLVAVCVGAALLPLAAAVWTIRAPRGRMLATEQG